MKDIIDYFGFDERLVTGSDESREALRQKSVVACLLRRRGETLRAIAAKLNTTTWRVIGLVAGMTADDAALASRYRDIELERKRTYECFKGDDDDSNRILRSVLDAVIVPDSAPESTVRRAESLPQLLQSCNVDTSFFLKRVGVSRLSYLKMAMGDKTVSARIIDRMVKCLGVSRSEVCAVVVAEADR